MTQPIANPLPLTTSQHAMWLLHTISGRGELFNVAECMVFKGKVAATTLQHAFNHVWQASDMLSCRFPHDAEYTPALQPTHTPPVIEVIQLEHDIEHIAEYAQQFMAPKLCQSFDLSSQPLMQLQLLRGESQDYLMILAHHLLLDGYGFGLFSQALSRSYNALMKNKALPNLRFSDQQTLLEAQRQTAYLATVDSARETLNQWLDNIGEVYSFSDSKADVTAANKRTSQQFTRTQWQTIQSAASLINSSSSEILLAAIAAALIANTQHYHVTLGLIMMNRQSMAELSAPCVQSNVLPLPLNLKKNMTLQDITALVNLQIKELKQVQSYRVESLKRDRQKQGKSLTVFGPTINLLPFSSNPKYAGIETQSHILSAGTTDDIMLQIHLLGDTPANIDFDVNEARYQPSHVNAIQAQVFDAAIRWANQPTLMLSELVKCLTQEPEYVV
ncbi:ferric siderophore synthetase subunit F [Pseudoalteromonas citrea]|uniref:Ferric siderophore synthetase subunit F n=1 Tax=Pseudoalteromonas citrea TaxID=43655 RepID=A0A5S3XJY3_9GAMM|nr:condensation domain-containing protein [Pseudoalteromonas citrea]TMP47377.1 ferric siderophore synthetase subunit F [Pseudoalteromonas citrea]TMP55009.1 ferric siderophore synthetase subunit F [Pseudoalteromonas citrea]